MHEIYARLAQEASSPAYFDFPSFDVCPLESKHVLYTHFSFVKVIFQWLTLKSENTSLEIEFVNTKNDLKSEDTKEFLKLERKPILNLKRAVSTWIF